MQKNPWSTSKPSFSPRPTQIRGMKMLVSLPGVRLFLKPGAGKTITVLKSFTILKKLGMVDALLVIAPLRVIVTSWPQQLDFWEDTKELTYTIIHGGEVGRQGAMKKDVDVYLMNIEGLICKEWAPVKVGGSAKRPIYGPNKLALNWIKSRRVMLAVDECFEGSAPVSTPNGEVRIDSIVVGQMVDTPIGPRKVVNVFKNKRTKNLVSIDGVISTEDHLYGTEYGWVKAKDLQVLQARVFTKKTEEYVLLQELCEEGYVGWKPPTQGASSGGYEEYNGGASVVEQGNPYAGRDKGNTLKIGKRAWCLLWKRQVQKWKRRTSSTGGNSTSSTSPGVYTWIRSWPKGVWGRVPKKLQSRPSLPSKEDSHRSSGEFTPQNGPQAARRKEEASSRIVRVENVDHNQQRSIEWVWDIEVEGAHCYYVNGKLVHNCTKFKNSKSLRFQSLKTYLPYFNRRVILTGTPQPNKLEDLFSQCYITDDGKDLGSYITHFRNNYMMPDKSGFGYVALPGALERVAAKIAPTTLQVKEEEVVPTDTNTIWVKMPEGARKIYNQLKNDFLTIIDGQEVMAPNAGVVFNKLRQVAQGAVFVEQGKWVELFPDKILALQNLLEELNGDPLFCLYQFSHDYERLERELGVEIPRVGGGISAAQGAAYCRTFAAGGVPLLLGHPLSVAHGVDGLQRACSNVCWLGAEPSWENYYQGNQRIVRSGTVAESVTIHRIFTECGVERAILEMMESKREDEATLLKLLREYLSQE